MASLVYPRENYSSWRKSNFKRYRKDTRFLIDRITDRIQDIINTSDNNNQAADALEKFRNRF